MGAVHARRLAQNSTVDSVVVADVAVDRAERLAASLDCAAVSVERLLASRPAGVVIAASTDGHADLVDLCVARGIPCLCEKPLTLELDRTVRLMRRLTDRDAYVQVGFHRRFDPDCARLRDEVDRGAVGTVRRLHLVSADRQPPPADFLPGSGGLFVDLMIHDADLVRWLTGAEVTAVYATGSAPAGSAFAAAGDVQNAGAVFTLAGGAVATVQAARDNGAGQDVRVEVAGTAATLVAGLDAGSPLRSVSPAAAFPEGPPWTGFLDRFAAAYAAEVDAFVDAVGLGTPPPCGVADAYEALAVALAATRSQREGRVVAVDEIRGGTRP
jgi:myo-inositol 2-dehydrogenase/D-chiro-inositol 1-dehydrogenase